MKRKWFKIVLVAEAVLCVLLTVFKAPESDAFLTLVAFPFEQIGMGLRALSLSSAVGNAFAILLYVAICLIPIGGLLLIKRKRDLLPEDSLLFVLSGLLFFVIYYMINPGAIMEVFRGIPAGKAVLGGTIYSVICAYYVLRVLRLFRAGGMEQLQRYFIILLSLLNAVIVYLIFGAGVGGLIESITALQQGNTGNEQLLGVSNVFIFLQYLVDILPYVFDLMVVFAGIKLLESMIVERYSDATVLFASHLSKLCERALQTTALALAAVNLLHIMFAKSIYNMNIELQIPLFSIAFVLAALLFSRLVAENKVLKEDNDSII